ncbi:MAG: SDR family oxidoreductase [Flavobacteriales bacterium]
MKTKNIIITGASSGIGEASARLLAAQGHRLLLIARRAGKLHQLANELGDVASVCPVDVTNYVELQRAFAEVVLPWGEVDVLINNAGVGYFEKIENGNVNHWHQMIDVNVKGLLHCIHLSMPHLLKSNGLIVNVGSVASHQVFANTGVYCATKHAVWAISESIRLELAGRVRVTTISPGSVNTPFIDNTTDTQMLNQYKDYFANAMPAKVVAEQIMHAVDCSPESVITEIIVRPNRQVK